VSEEGTSQPPGRKLAFIYHPASFSVFQVVEAARELCSIIWVVDSGIDDSAVTARLLPRFGAVVDVAGMDGEQVAAAVGQLQPDGILTFKDSRLRFTADLAARLGLPFHTPQVAARLTDKHAQRLALRDAGVAVPGFFTVPPIDQAEGWKQLAERIHFPAVLKPRLGNEASRDTVRVESLEAVREVVAAGTGEELVLEEYLGDRVGAVRSCFADYVSVESVVSHGRISHIAVNGRFPPAEPFRESGFFIDAELSSADRQAALDTATAALQALGIETGCPHTEIKFTPEGARVIEVNGRIGGGVPEMLSDITDLALLRDALRIALGETVQYERPVVPERVGFLFYVHAPKSMTKITSVEGLDRLAADTDVTEATLNRGPGQAVDWREGNHGHVFSVRGTVADHDALEVMDGRVHAEVQISGE
jgi:biotin carboxylase